MTETPKDQPDPTTEPVSIPVDGAPPAAAGGLPLDPEPGADPESDADPVGEVDVGGSPGAGVPMEPASEAIHRLETELDEFRDRHARLAAEFDNYRKRTSRENQVLAERAQAALAIKVLDVLDDLDRILDGMDEETSAEALREAIELVDKKLRKELEAAGLERIDPAGAPFDPSEHEAVATAPPPDPAQDHHVGVTFQAGYRFKGNLIRPARVQVYTDQGQG